MWPALWWRLVAHGPAPSRLRPTDVPSRHSASLCEAELSPSLPRNVDAFASWPSFPSTLRGTALPVDLPGHEERHEQHDSEDVFKGVDHWRDRHREERVRSVSDNGKEEEERADDRQAGSQSDSPEEKGGDRRQVQEQTGKDGADRDVANGLQIGRWAALEAE